MDNFAHIKKHIIDFSAADDEKTMCLVFFKQIWYVAIIGKMDIAKIASMECGIFREHNMNAVFEWFATETFKCFPAHNKNGIGCFGGYLSKMC